MERRKEITANYLKALDDHLLDIVEQRTTEMLEINEIADRLNINATHLSDTVKRETGKSACYFFEHKIIDIAKALLERGDRNVTQVAFLLTYDPSNFTKFFKAYTNQTPKQYQNAHRQNNGDA